MTTCELTGRSASLPPADARLPGLLELLDRESAGCVLGRSRGHDVGDVRVTAVRYKPGRRLVVQYELDGPGDARTAAASLDAKADLRRLAAPPGVTFDDEAAALVQWWPSDPALPALALPPRELAEAVAVDASSCERLGYKPLARATLRLDEHVVKLYGSEEKWRRAAHALRRVARTQLEHTVPKVRATVQRFVEGSAPAGPEVAESAGALLHELHGSDPEGLPRVDAAARLEDAVKVATLVATIVPALAARVETLKASLARSRPVQGRRVTAHGDFDPGQLVANGQTLTLVDLDDLCGAPAADDLARYAAHAVRGEPGDADAVANVVSSLLAGYGAQPDGLDWYLVAAVLGRAAAPFRSQEPDWPRRVEAFLAAAEQLAEGL
jgi:hypothetical protein